MTTNNSNSNSVENILEQLTLKLTNMKNSSQTAFLAAKTSAELYQRKVEFLGKNGVITEVMKAMGTLSKEQKPEFGKKVNEVKNDLEAIYDTKEAQLKSLEMNSQLASQKIDLTLPPPPDRRGHPHPVYLVMHEIVGIMSRLGYSIRLGPSIESDFYNFEALNIPANHPAREMQDTFFIDSSTVLRTHTSPIQIHALENETLPLRIIGTGPVFRCDSDVSHLPNFHQIEGMCVDKKVSMADLKGTISYFVREFFQKDLKTRFRPSFFPFTEPSAEVDCECPICHGKGCSLCKGSGWIEIGGSGLINPKVLTSAKVDAEKWQGFAFGFGLERMAMIKYGIPDIRLFPQNDQRFIKQF
jgi:phenylalanyl-tRNA synthetase alpha chain